MLACVALGGNALLRRGEPLTLANQRANSARAAAALAMLAKDAQLVIAHGNGPQVGLLSLQSAASDMVEVYPLDVLGAETEGMIGYILEQELSNALGPEHRIATLLTQIEVSGDDPALKMPSKPIGPIYGKEVARRLGILSGWVMAPDGPHWRRVVASPRPKRIRSIEVLRLLAESGVTLICAGGGGIPTVPNGDGKVRGIDAVIDKDLTASLLARELKADTLIMLTDVEAVFDGWETSNRRAICIADPESLRRMSFARGSMEPKIAAAIEFATSTQRPAFIGRMEDAARLISGEVGTRIDLGAKGIVYR
jgi:carbamate kinase